MLELYMKRIQNATRAAERASSPVFRKYWVDVAYNLNEQKIKKFG